MKKILAFVTFSFFYCNAQAQWFLVNPLPQYNKLNDVEFISSSVGWAVGAMGTILKTTNGGTSWQFQTSGTINELFSICFTDANNGTTVGKNSTILRTTNGGITWLTQSTTEVGSLWDVHFIDTNIGIAVGGGQNSTSHWNIILKTTNGGNTWQVQESGTTDWLYSVYLTDANNGITVGSNGSILRTTDGGTTWTSQWNGTDYFFSGISFTDPSNARVISYDSAILKTSDSGATWSIEPFDISMWMTDISFINSNTGTIVGNDGKIVHTIDGGTTWTLQESGTTKDLLGVAFTDINNGTVVGESGTILRTTNGGTPVELISFIANQLDNSVELNWSTASEMNNFGFEIEKCIPDPKNDLEEKEWIQIGFINGYGTTNEVQHYSYIDKNISDGRYYYRLKQVDFDGTFDYSNEIQLDVTAIKNFSLFQNFPNPFNPTTVISYQLLSQCNVQLKVFDILGRELVTLVNEEKPAGSYEVIFSADDLASGIYFYQLNAGNLLFTKKMILLR